MNLLIFHNSTQKTEEDIYRAGVKDVKVKDRKVLE